MKVRGVEVGDLVLEGCSVECPNCDSTHTYYSACEGEEGWACLECGLTQINYDGSKD